MHIRPKNVFKAICYGHGCSIDGTALQKSQANLIDISNNSARLLLLSDPEASGETMLRRGDNVTLHPHFIENTEFETIPTQVAYIEGHDVVLRFESPLPLTSSRLVTLTRR